MPPKAEPAHDAAALKNNANKDMPGPMWQDLTPPTAPLTRTGKVAWLMSFIDLLNIIICAFVMMFAMKAVDLKRWDTLSGSFKGVFAPAPSIKVEVPDGQLNAPEARDDIRAPLTDVLQYLDSVLRRRLAGDPVWGGLQGTFDPVRRELRYPLPASVTTDDWQRLVAALRRFDNPLVLEVDSPPAEAVARTTAVVQVYRNLRAAGLSSLSGVVWRPGRVFGVSLLVRGTP